MNPNLDYGQGVPGRNTGRGAGIIATRRLVAIVDAARLLAASPAWAARDADGLRAWGSAYAAVWLRTSPNGREEAKITALDLRKRQALQRLNSAYNEAARKEPVAVGE